MPQDRVILNVKVQLYKCAGVLGKQCGAYNGIFILVLY